MKTLTAFLLTLASSMASADLLTPAANPLMSIPMGSIGGACPGLGATAFAASGLLLSCQSGTWQKATIAITGYTNCGWINGGAYTTRYCPAPKVQVGMDYNGYGSGYSDHDIYCCELN